MKQEEYILDEIDKHIIQMLMDSDKNPLAVISQKVGISTTGVHQRVKKLEQADVIETAASILNPRRIGYKVSCFVGIYVNRSNETDNVMDHLKGINEVVEAHYVTGSYTLLVKLVCKDNDHLMSILRQIQNVEGITRTETLISLGQEVGRQLKIVE